MKTLIRHMDGHIFLAKSDSNHWVPLDTGAASGGTEAANNPFQMLTIGAAGCVSIDVVDVLKKSRKDFSGFELNLEITRAETHPKIIRTMFFHVSVNGPDLTEDLVQRAVVLSLTRYCSASLSLDRSVTFTADICLNGATGSPFDIPRDPALYA